MWWLFYCLSSCTRFCIICYWGSSILVSSICFLWIVEIKDHNEFKPSTFYIINPSVKMMSGSISQNCWVANALINNLVCVCVHMFVCFGLEFFGCSLKWPLRSSADWHSILDGVVYQICFSVDSMESKVWDTSLLHEWVKYAATCGSQPRMPCYCRQHLGLSVSLPQFITPLVILYQIVQEAFRVCVCVFPYAIIYLQHTHGSTYHIDTDVWIVSLFHHDVAAWLLFLFISNS